MLSSAHLAPSIRRAGTLLYRQLFNVLRDEIARGVYAQTGALPKEEDLCRRFEVSRITVRRSLAELEAIGLVERRPGLGTFVRGLPREARPTPNLGFLDRLRQTATETEVDVLTVERVKPLPDIGALLQLPAGEPAFHAVRIRSVKGTPVFLTDAWTPAALGKRVTAAALRKQALYQVLMDKGVVYGRVVQEITAQAASPEVAGLLRTEVGAPLIRLVRLMHDRQARPVLHLTAYLPSERSRILMDIPAEKINTFDAGWIDYGHPSGGMPAGGA